jgi:hypothetical protein
LVGVLLQLAAFTLWIRLGDRFWAWLSPDHIPDSLPTVILWGCVIIGAGTALDVWRKRRGRRHTSRSPHTQPQR